MNGKFFHIPMDVATNPRTGECLCKRWWAVHPEKGLAFYYQPFGYCRSDEPAPQCNASEATARHLTKQLNPDHDVVYIPVVYLQHAMQAMREDKEILKKERAA